MPDVDRDKTYKIPSGAQGNAQQALDWRKEHGDDVAGMTATGWRRARQLAEGGDITLQDLIEINAWFARHSGNESVADEHEDEPWRDAGYVGHLGWGGDTMRSFAADVVDRLEKSGPSYMLVQHAAGPAAPRSSKWDERANREAIIAWATAEDGTTDWSKVRRAYLAYDESRPEDVRGFVGLHHRLVEDDDGGQVLCVDQRRVGTLQAKFAGLHRDPDYPEDVLRGMEAHLGFHRETRATKDDGQPEPCPRCGYHSSGDACPLCGSSMQAEVSHGGVCVMAYAPDKVAEAAAERRDALGRVLGEPLAVEGQPHATVLYLGELAAGTIDDVVEAVYQVAEGCEPIKIRPKGITSFEMGDDGTPVVVDLGEGGPLADLHNAMLRACAPYVGAKQFPEFRAHMTLGYLARALDDREAATLPEIACGVPGWTVESLTIMDGDRVAAEVPLASSPDEPTARVERKVPIDLRDRARPSGMANTSDDDLHGLHSDLHAAFSEGDGMDDDDLGGWYNAHREVVEALEARGFDHPEPTEGEQLDTVGQQLQTLRRQAPDTADGVEPAQMDPPPTGEAASDDRPAPGVDDPSRPGGAVGSSVRTAKGTRVARMFKSSLDDADDVWFAIVYEPYTLDAHDQWMRPEHIRRACNLYGMRHRTFNDEHQRALPRGEAVLAQSWIVPETYEDGGQMITKGTWVVGVKLFGETLRRAEAGQFTGFSLEGPGFLVDHGDIDYERFDAVTAA